ncbi:MAG TPA: stage 0 sporulation family protein [Oscillospiraceae bacterium]|nr:stage 0 sporulation family protein [Oscillospiraceae bacterium]
MVTVVGVRFKKAGKIYYFDPIDIETSEDDFVIVETVRGIEFGQVVVGPKQVSEEDIVSPLKPVIRVATEEDNRQHIENKMKEGETLEICMEKVQKHNLDMNSVDVEHTIDNNKVIFYFTADGRVDFRELVRDLASVFKTRIELRQIGVRDEAKMLGGVGPCGRHLCCATWLGDFEPVSIKMAKDQELSLNPAKISGICGRLFCCLKYEHDAYVQTLAKMPGIGSVVLTPDGEGVVVETNVLLEVVKVKINDLDNPNDSNSSDNLDYTDNNNEGIQTYSLYDVTEAKKIETEGKSDLPKETPSESNNSDGV